MPRRPGLARTSALGAFTTLALSASMLAVTGTADGAVTPGEEFFAPRLVTVDTPTRGDKDRLQELGLDLTEHAGHDYVEAVLHTPADRAALTGAGFTFDVRIPDLIARSIEVAEINEAYAASVDESPLPSGRTGYRTLDDFNADLTALADDNPGLVKRFELKRPSLDGRPIYGVEISQGVRQPNRGEPTFLLMGVHHAREWPSGELAMEFAIDLVKNFGRDERITGLLRQARVVVVPVVNVDGFNLSRTDGEFVDLREAGEYDPLGGTTPILLTPGTAYMRKNCRVVDGEDTPDGSCAAAHAAPGGYGIGTDLNRNYGGFWGGPGASTTNADPTYRGASAFSEPETKNIQDLVTSRQITMLISNHTFSNLVLRPNGVNPGTIAADGLPVGDAPDEKGLKKLGAKMTAQNGYANIHGWQLYDTTGTTEDYSYNATGGFGFTFEIGENEFHPPYAEVVDEYLGAGEYAGRGNREAYLIALEHAVDRQYSGVLTGKAPKGATIRLTKTFQSPTWEGSFEDGLDTAIKVGANGRFEWLVNPSTRPVVESRTYQVLADEPLKTETFEGITPAPNSYTDHEFVVDDAAKVLDIALDWPTPDDLDLEVYRKDGDELVEVASSGNFVGSKEATQVADPEPATYVLRVINFASASPTYTLTAGLFDAVTKRTEGKREAYTLTCEKGGKVLQETKVFIDRGQSKTVDLKACRKRG